MRLARPLTAFVLALAPLAAQTIIVQPAKAEKTTETRTLPLASGSTLKVKNVNGFIRVEAWDREEVQFTGEFKPSSKDEQVKVVLELGDRNLVIRGEYPKNSGWRWNYHSPECNMTLKVPRRVSAKLATVNGEVVLSGTQGAARLTTVNGGVRATDLADSLKATTVNGAITFAQVRGELVLQTVNGAIKGSGLDGLGKGLKASTVNGSIHLQTAGLKGRLKASTLDGAITFNAKGAEQVEIKKKTVDGELRSKVTAVFPGEGQGIELETVNGAITLD